MYTHDFFVDIQLAARHVRTPLRSTTKRMKKELGRVRMATRMTLKDQMGLWDRMKAVLKLKLDREGAVVLLDMLVYIYVLSPAICVILLC